MTAAQADGRVAVQLAHVVANAVVNPEYRHLILRCVAPATEATPGQFFQLLCPAASPDAPFLRRPMSVYGIDPDNQQIEFLYKVTGAGTRGLASLGPGDTLDIMGPLGCGFVLDPVWRHVSGLAGARQERGAMGVAVDKSDRLVAVRRPRLTTSSRRGCGTMHDWADGRRLDALPSQRDFHYRFVRSQGMPMTIVPIRGLFEAHLTVSDLDRSIAFYRDVLGLPLAHRIPARQVAFFWVPSSDKAMLGLWSIGTSPLRLRLHIAFDVALPQVFESVAALRRAGHHAAVR